MVGLKFGDDYYKWLQDKYTHMRKLFLDGLDRIGIQHNVPQGAYYVMVDVSEFGYESDLRLCEALAEHVGVGAVPGSSFFREPENRYIRLHFAKQDATLNAALERLQDIRPRHNITGQAMNLPGFNSEFRCRLRRVISNDGQGRGTVRFFVPAGYSLFFSRIT